MLARDPADSLEDYTIEDNSGGGCVRPCQMTSAIHKEKKVSYRWRKVNFELPMPAGLQSSACLYADRIWLDTTFTVRFKKRACMCLVDMPPCSESGQWCITEMSPFGVTVGRVAMSGANGLCPRAVRAQVDHNYPNSKNFRPKQFTSVIKHDQPAQHDTYDQVRAQPCQAKRRVHNSPTSKCRWAMPGCVKPAHPRRHSCRWTPMHLPMHADADADAC